MLILYSLINQMAKNKGSRITITLECSCRNLKNIEKRSNGIFRYTTTKNRRNTPNRIELKKFCPKCNQHQIFKEIK
nr:50S ribosomal protein L33 [Corallina ferreyrae]YP_009660649.1 50S ribosomal protein L33 [Corallina chilensis]QBL75697.1 50S ribosomal protein L33 [Corallina ferreyrae]QCS25597.1 50S ribosomal protein L33 [Corallina chilensis]